MRQVHYQHWYSPLVFPCLAHSETNESKAILRGIEGMTRPLRSLLSQRLGVDMADKTIAACRYSISEVTVDRGYECSEIHWRQGTLRLLKAGLCP